MRMFDAESQVLNDLKEECDLIGERTARSFTVVTARHPTLGKLVIVVAPDGSGVVVETEE
jgi:hypothetical protein